MWCRPSKHFWTCCLHAGLAATALLAAGCATLTAPTTEPQPDYLSSVDQCVTHLAEEAWLTVEPNHDRSFYRPDAQPWFAITRFMAHFDPATLSEPAFNEWRIRVIDHSWQELENHQLQVLGESMPASRACLVTVAMATPASTWQQYAEAAREYDLYRDWQRWVGVYPLTSLVLNQRIRAAQRQWAEDYGSPNDLPARLWQPASRQESNTFDDTLVNDNTITDWFRSAYSASALDLPLLRREELQSLFQAHAPDLLVLQESSADQLGSVGAESGQALFQATPAATYVQPMMTRFDGENLLQLVYTFWFAERPKSSALDIYGGAWNGITWRVTLGTEGDPLWYDTIHNCGCYHHVWLSDDWQPGPNIGRESPLFLPLDWEGRPRLTLTAGEHYVRQVVAADTDRPATVEMTDEYDFKPYTELMRLSDKDASTTVSLFNRYGLIAESARLERFVFWPFGVHSPGAMRRTGTHTIVFIGKRHFDDPTLFESLIVPATN